jgi:hypothetical protein
MRGKLFAGLALAFVLASVFVVAPADAARCRPVTLSSYPPPPGPPKPVTTTTTAAPVAGEDLAPPPPPTVDRSRIYRHVATCFVYPMEYPLLEVGRVTSLFGEFRDGGRRLHAGNDIPMPRLTPVVAVAAGEVVKMENNPKNDRCCFVKIRHDDGWYSVYIHLNNDTYGTDDGRSKGVRADLELGDRVRAGEVIGWVGDSSNAEDTVDHLHFELRNRSDRPVDPQPSLKAAAKEAPLALPADWEGDFQGPFFDDDGLADEKMYGWLLTKGYIVPCELGAGICPDQPITRADLALWLELSIGVEVPSFEPEEAEPLETPLPRREPKVTVPPEDVSLASALKCLEGGCPSEALTESKVWQIIDWAMTHQTEVEEDDAALPTELALEPWSIPGDEARKHLIEAGILENCPVPAGDPEVTRASVLTILARMVGYPSPAAACDAVS